MAIGAAAGLAAALCARPFARAGQTSGPLASARPAAANPLQLPDDPLLGFVDIPAGPFIMGTGATADPLAFDNERWSAGSAQGTVDVPRFLLAKYEVTVAQFQAFVAATGFKADPRALQAPASHPVAFVSWPDALAYCRWATATLAAWPGAPPRLTQVLRDGWTVTLPSEAEWEKAARGTDGRIFPWGDAPRRDRANYESGAAGPVGRFDCPECPYPLFDMSGNVWEWTRSPYQPYPFDPGDDRTELGADALWVMRGGHFGDPARNVRTTTRGGADPGARRAIIGFRVAISRGER
jgi:formylglycine-generating enzyme required for sulfatase activity